MISLGVCIRLFHLPTPSAGFHQMPSCENLLSLSTLFLLNTFRHTTIMSASSPNPTSKKDDLRHHRRHADRIQLPQSLPHRPLFDLSIPLVLHLVDLHRTLTPLGVNFHVTFDRLLASNTFHLVSSLECQFNRVACGGDFDAEALDFTVQLFISSA